MIRGICLSLTVAALSILAPKAVADHSVPSNTILAEMGLAEPVLIALLAPVQAVQISLKVR